MLSFFELSFVMSRPSIVIFPLSTVSRPPIQLRNVDLPEPDEPSITQVSPFDISAEIPFKTCVGFSFPP